MSRPIGPKDTLSEYPLFLQAGIDPNTGLPIKFEQACNNKAGILQQLVIQDEQDAVNRYAWYNLPEGISSQELERWLYHKGQLCFFYCKPLDQFMILPYALDGTIDAYGRFNTIHPVPLAGGTSEKEKDQVNKLADYLSTLKLKVVKDVMVEMPEEEDLYNSAVILWDYSPTTVTSQTIIPRQAINAPLLGIEAECIPLMRTALFNSCGTLGLRVNNEDEQSNVDVANRTFEDAALANKRYIPIIGNMEFQDLSGQNGGNIQDFMLAMQSLDNYRLSTYGLKGGLLEKNSQVLQAEESLNAGIASYPLIDGLNLRQHACDIINSIWAIGIDCELSEIASGMDKDLDGEIGSDHFDDQKTPMEGESDESTEQLQD